MWSCVLFARKYPCRLYLIVAHYFQITPVWWQSQTFHFLEYSSDLEPIVRLFFFWNILANLSCLTLHMFPTERCIKTGNLWTLPLKKLTSHLLANSVPLLRGPLFFLIGASKTVTSLPYGLYYHRRRWISPDDHNNIQQAAKFRVVGADVKISTNFWR